jgi:hypothetical protein
MIFTEENITNTLDQFEKINYKYLDGDTLQITGEFDNCLCRIDGDDDILRITYRNKVEKINDGFDFLEFLTKVE